MTLILPSTLLAVQLVVSAFAFPTSDLNATAAAIDMISSQSCTDIHKCRTITSLLWSCLTTVFLSTWVTVHPNCIWRKAPHTNASSNHNNSWNLENIFESRTRLGLLGLMFAAPEIVVAIAYNEWTKACKHTTRLSAQYPDIEWTETHGMMTVMNGFEVVKDDDRAANTTSLRDLIKYLKKYDIDFSKITEGVIMDKSKGDTIGKLLVLLQTSWFATQCVARAATKLPLTGLELTTLGHTAFVSITYFFWWNKPVDVRYPIVLHAKRRRDRASYASAEASGSGGTGEANGNMTIAESSRDGYLNDMRMHSPSPLAKTSTELTFPLLKASTELAFSDGLEGPFRLPWRVRFGNYVPGVPKLYELETGRHWLAFIFLVFTSGVFGAIHCLGWNSSAITSSLPETYYWRAAAVTVTAVPVAAVSLSGMIPNAFKLKIYEVDVIVWPLLCLYMCARLSLITLAFISLRDLPNEAYAIPSWTNVIPHL